MASSARPRVLILGGGYVGLYTAWGLEKQFAEGDVEVTVVEPNSHMTYYPLLPEVAGGHVDPRDVAVPLASSLTRTTVIRGDVRSVSLAERTATVGTFDGGERTLAFDQVVFALGAVTRAFPTPGLDDYGIGFKSIEEAVWLRDHVLDSIAKAAMATDPAERDRYLTFVVVGGGYTGVEALTELLDLSQRAARAYPTLAGRPVRWHLIEALDRVAPEVGPELSAWTLEQLRDRRIEVHLKTTMPSCEGGVVELSSGRRIPANTIMWTAGVTPNPALDRTDVPRGPKGHVNANASLQVIDDDGHPLDGVWAAGDNAQVPDLTKAEQPAYYPPNAQHAVRQAKLLGRNIAASIRGGAIAEYRFESIGTVAEYGVGRGAANIKGVQMKNLPAWLAHRGYHALAVPTLTRKWRVVSNWITRPGGPDLASLSASATPRAGFQRAVAQAEAVAAARKQAQQSAGAQNS